MPIKQRIISLRKRKGLTQRAFSEAISIDSSQYSKIEQGKINLTIHQLIEISSFFNVSLDWLCRGSNCISNSDHGKNLIPFYAELEPRRNIEDFSKAKYQKPNMMIDAGDWFLGATCAVRHFGDSMNEYQNGSVLVVRKIKNTSEIEWGNNYVIETLGMRITKKIAELDRNNIICYSTNSRTYPDGRVVHQPITVLKTGIKSIYKILGSVNKEVPM